MTGALAVDADAQVHAVIRLGKRRCADFRGAYRPQQRPAMGELPRPIIGDAHSSSSPRRLSSSASSTSTSASVRSTLMYVLATEVLNSALPGKTRARPM